MKVSKKDIKLLLILASVILIAGSYYFGYLQYNDKRTVLEDEIVTLQKKYDSLYVKDLKRADYQTEVKIFTDKIKEISIKYPSEITPEKEIMFADEVEHYANAVISTWSFAEPEIFYASKDLVAETEIANTTGEGNNTESSNNTGTSLTSTVMGFKTVTTYGFKVGYDGLKNMITYINNSPKRKVLDNIMITYDGVSGELTGTLSINNYFVSGALATYEPPIITDINLGTSNLFGDMIPVKPDENNGEQKTNNQNTNSQKTNDANGGQEQSPAPTAEQ